MTLFTKTKVKKVWWTRPEIQSIRKMRSIFKFLGVKTLFLKKGLF